MNKNDTKISSGIVVTDFLCYLVTYWKSILAAGLVFACLLGGFSYYKASKSAAAADNTASAASTENTGNFSEEDIVRLDSVAENLAGYMRQREAVLDYCENAPVMKTDPTNVVKRKLIYCVSISDSNSSSLEKIAALVESLANIPQDSEFLSAAGQASGVKQEYVSGMITAESIDYSAYAGASSGTDQSSGSTDNAEMGILDDSSSNSVFYSFTILGASEQEVNAVGDELDKYAAALQSENAVGFYDFKLSKPVDNLFICSSYDIESTQFNVYARLYNINDKIDSITDDLTSQEKEYVESRLSEEDTEDTAIAGNQSEETQSQKQISKVRPSKKYILAGLILGMFLIIIYRAFRYAFNRRIMTVYDFDCDSFKNMVLVGNINQKSAFGNRINAARYSGTHIYNPDNAGAVLAAQIDLEMRKFSDKKNIFFVSTNLSDADKALIENIRSSVRSENVVINSADHVNDNADTIRKLADADQVYVIGRLNETGRSEYSEQLNLLHNLGTECRTCILYI